MAKKTAFQNEKAQMARELASAFMFAASSYASGKDVPLETIRKIEASARIFFTSLELETIGTKPLEVLDKVLKELIPESSLPLDIESHEHLSESIIVALSGKVVLVEKEWFDRVTETGVDPRREKSSQSLDPSAN